MKIVYSVNSGNVQLVRAITIELGARLCSGEVGCSTEQSFVLYEMIVLCICINYFNVAYWDLHYKSMRIFYTIISSASDDGIVTCSNSLIAWHQVV